MMNAELVNKVQSKTIIPIVSRDDYLFKLKRITNQIDPAHYMEMLTKVYQFSENLHFGNYDDLFNCLEVHNAFLSSR